MLEESCANSQSGGVMSSVQGKNKTAQFNSVFYFSASQRIFLSRQGCFIFVHLGNSVLDHRVKRKRHQRRHSRTEKYQTPKSRTAGDSGPQNSRPRAIPGSSQMKYVWKCGNPVCKILCHGHLCSFFSKLISTRYVPPFPLIPGQVPQTWPACRDLRCNPHRGTQIHQWIPRVVAYQRGRCECACLVLVSGTGTEKGNNFFLSLCRRNHSWCDFSLKKQSP